jgi:hypothetical protein
MNDGTAEAGCRIWCTVRDGDSVSLQCLSSSCSPPNPPSMRSSSRAPFRANLHSSFLQRAVRAFPVTTLSSPLPPQSASFASASRALSPLVAVSHAPVFFDKVGEGTIPAFRLLDGEGKVMDEVSPEWRTKLEAVSPEILIKMYKTMLMLPALVSC